MRKFIRKEVEKITGISARTIQHYTDQGLINLEEEKPGRGKERQYTRDNVFELLVIKELKMNGVELSRIKYLLVEGPKKYPAAFRKFEYDYIKNRIKKQYRQSVKSIHFVVLKSGGQVFFKSTRSSSQQATIDLSSMTSGLIINLNVLVELIEKH